MTLNYFFDRWKPASKPFSPLPNYTSTPLGIPVMTIVNVNRSFKKKITLDPATNDERVGVVRV
jgi:hypothetical protein